MSKSIVNKDYQFAAFRASKCSSIRCLNSPKLIKDKYFASNITHQKFNIINQYVGDATISLHK